MKEILEKYSDINHCPVRNILSYYSSKWGMLLLILLEDAHTLRFSEIASAIPDISPKMLSSTLKTLETDGLLTRTIYASVPPKVEYSITPLGTELAQILKGLASWALKNYDIIKQNREKNS